VSLLRKTVRTLVDPTGVRRKRAQEFEWWRERRATLGNLHYRWFYTEHFGLSTDFYAGKRVLDIGCGPAGSLEWAGMAAERIGLDPLADAYRKLGIELHQMTYVNAPVERIPFPQGYFEIVAAINSLDHVEDPRRAIREICRVTAPGAALLLIVEVNHPPTPVEPHSLGWDVVDLFRPEWEVTLERHYAEGPGHMLLVDVQRGIPYDHDASPDAPGVLSVLMTRRP